MGIAKPRTIDFKQLQFLRSTQPKKYSYFGHFFPKNFQARVKMEVVVLPLMALALVVGSMIGKVEGAVSLPPVHLTRQFYKKTNTCADVEAFVKHQVTIHWNQDKTLTPKLLRLVYSDCMVTVCAFFLFILLVAY